MTPMFNLARLKLPAPITLLLYPSRLGVAPAPPVGAGTPVVFEWLEIYTVIDLVRKSITAQIARIPPPVILYTADDFLEAVTDTPDQHAARLLVLLGGDVQASLQALIDGTAPQDPAASPRPVRRFSKLKIRRTLRDLGAECLLDDFLASSPTALADWNDSQVIMIDDPVLVQCLPAFAHASNMTEAQITAILQSCRD